MAVPKKHVMRRITEAVCSTPWAIEEGALAQIVELLQLRRNGYEFTEQEIQARINLSKAEPSEGEEDGPQVLDGVAVLPLFGVLAPRLSMMQEISGGTSTQIFGQWFEQALKDPNIKAIVLNVDSPGGSAYGNEEIAQIIRAARGQKPIKAVATNMMASAAYYIGSAADELIASPSAEVGSIGTYMIHGEGSRAAANEGYTYTVVKAGENKAVGNNVEPLTSSARAVLQERIDNLNTQFVAAVATNRNVSPETVNKNFGQGKVMLAPAAKAAGLVDRVGTLNQVVGELRAKSAQTLTPKKLDIISADPAPVSGARIVTAQIKAALVKMGLIDAEASDVMAMAIMRTFFLSRGSPIPTAEDKILAALAHVVTPGQMATLTKTEPPEPEKSGATAVDEKRIRQIERARIQDLQARGDLLKIGQDQILEAIDGGMSVADALLQWTEERANNAPTFSTSHKIESGLAQDDKILSGAVEALGRRAGFKADPKLDSVSHDFKYKTLLQIAEISLQATGKRVNGDPDDIAKAAIRGDREDITIRADTLGYARPADFPNLMSNLMGKAMDIALEEDESTYQYWAAPIDSVPDFKPQTLIATGEFGEFPRVEDGKPFTGSNVAEEASWIAVDKYGDEWALTPRMIVDGRIDVIIDAAQGKQTAHEATLNRLCVNLLTGNVTIADGNSLFDDTNHGNDIASGGAPSTTELAKIRLKLRKQKGVSALRKVNLNLAALLVPEDLETTTQQLLAPNIVVAPTTTSTGEIFRGSVAYYVEPMLGDVSATIYYGFARKTQARAIVYAKQIGFEKMKSRLYYDEKTNNRILQCEGRFAAAVRQWRGVVRDNGA